MSSKNPFIIRKRNPLWGFVRPVSVGTISGAILAACPKYLDFTWQLRAALVERIPGVSALPDRIYLAILGFILGFSVAKGCSFVKWRLLKVLLAYKGWMTAPRAYKTKAWAMLLQMVKGPRPYSTFEFQSYLPKQPLPNLDETLDRWLRVSSPILTKDEFEMTKEAVEDFRRNEGPILHKFLKEKADQTESWIYDYWMSGVYLSNRTPCAVYNNYYVQYALPDKVEQLARAAVVTSLTLRFAQLLEEDKIPPVELMDLIPLCMSGYRFMFNCTRVPGEYMDELKRFPGHKHIVVTRKGYYFKIDFHHRDANGKLSVATPEEIKAALEEIIKEADKYFISRYKFHKITAEEIKAALEDIVKEADSLQEDVPAVAALTGQKRNIWAKQRHQLKEKNAETLHDIESSLFLLDIDDVSPKTSGDHGKRTTTGNGYNRWFDKTMNGIIYEDGEAAINVEHSGLDAMVCMTLTEYVMINESYHNGDIIRNPKQPARPLPKAKRLTWDITGMEDAITTAYKELTDVSNNIEVNLIATCYGKGYMKKTRCSPDGFIQMALQLAYYKMHRAVVKTYEPSTGRLFQLGRTETINPISSMSVAWLKAMEDPEITWQTRQDLLKKAIKCQSKQRLDATIGQGCDRHLFALMCASREQGMDFPKIFMDKSWQDPYVLSTSQTPCRAWDIGAIADYANCHGGFAPGCHNGYGISYGLHGDDILVMSITSWKSCEETDCMKFGKAIDDALEEMKELFSH